MENQRSYTSVGTPWTGRRAESRRLTAGAWRRACSRSLASETRRRLQTHRAERGLIFCIQNVYQYASSFLDCILAPILVHGKAKSTPASSEARWEQRRASINVNQYEKMIISNGSRKERCEQECKTHASAGGSVDLGGLDDDRVARDREALKADVSSVDAVVRDVDDGTRRAGKIGRRRVRAGRERAGRASRDGGSATSGRKDRGGRSR